MFDLKLVKEDTNKEIVTFMLYVRIRDELNAICKKEGIKLSHLLRHIINVFLEERKKDES